MKCCFEIVVVLLAMVVSFTFWNPNNLSSCRQAPASSAWSCQRQRRWIRVRCGVSSPVGCHDLHCAAAWPPVVRVPLPGWPFCAPRPGCAVPGRVGAAPPFGDDVPLLVVHETFASPTPFSTEIHKWIMMRHNTLHFQKKRMDHAKMTQRHEWIKQKQFERLKTHTKRNKDEYSFFFVYLLFQLLQLALALLVLSLSQHFGALLPLDSRRCCCCGGGSGCCRTAFLPC